MSRIVHTEYHQGMNAYYAGEARTSNPHDNEPRYTRAAADWYAGYDDAQFDGTSRDNGWRDEPCWICGAEPGETCAADCEDRH